MKRAVIRGLQIIVGLLLIPFLILSAIGALARKIIDLAVEKVFWL